MSAKHRDHLDGPRASTPNALLLSTAAREHPRLGGGEGVGMCSKQAFAHMQAPTHPATTSQTRHWCDLPSQFSLSLSLFLSSLIYPKPSYISVHNKRDHSGKHLDRKFALSKPSTVVYRGTLASLADTLTGRSCKVMSIFAGSSRTFCWLLTLDRDFALCSP